jgi:hypothetical protein
LKLFIINAALIWLFFSTAALSQNYIDIGITAGTGLIRSDSPYLSGFNTSFSAGWGTLYNNINPRLSLYYAGDFNSLMPTSKRDYYPFIRGAALKGVYAVNVTADLYYEQSLGVFVANDRIFDISDSWGVGFIAGIQGGLDLRGDYYSGFRAGIGAEYGLTVYNRYISYLSLFIQLQYIIAYNF